MIANTLHVWGDLFAFAIAIGLIAAGRAVGGALGGLLIALGLAACIWSGLDSAAKLLGTDWSFLERLYHLWWVLIGVGAGAIVWIGIRDAMARTRSSE